MPALLSNVSDYKQTPLAVQLNPFWSTLPAGALDRMLIEASEEANSFCHRRLSTPPTGVTVGTAGAASQSLTVPLSTGANIYDGDVLLFPSTNEVVEVMGVEITDYTSPPYPATATLNTPIQNPYASGATVTVYRQDRVEIFGKRTDVFDVNAAGSQAGQVARMHAPKVGMAGNARIVMVNQYPLWSVYKAFQSLTWAGSTETTADLSNAYIDRATGTFRLSLGYFNPLLSYWRVQYVAGYASIPHDIRDAVHLLLSDIIVRAMNPIGAVSIRSEGQQAHMTRTSQVSGEAAPEALHVERAKKILKRYKRKGR